MVSYNEGISQHISEFIKTNNAGINIHADINNANENIWKNGESYDKKDYKNNKDLKKDKK